MDIFFQDPTAAPLPPDEVRIRELRAEPYPDGRRVRIAIEIDPFQKRPNLEVTLADAEGQELAQASVIGTMIPHIEFTMHIRAAKAHGPYAVAAILFYTAPITPDSIEAPERMIVDQKQASFEKI